jgi:23S rRNA (cytidine1920-2'-O)/16S rRNA (cytidine1409-2'-O)-methyltransferase
MAKIRVDQLLVERGLAESRSKAQAMVLAGQVYSDTKRIDKAGVTLAEDAPLSLKGQAEHPWVSRGGMKLAHALKEFNRDVTGFVALDVGSSTGGFTDVLLQSGAEKVYAVDVGTNQLAWSLRQDARVISLEQTNARYLTSDEIPEAVDLVVCDASFIGLEVVLPAAIALTKEQAQLITLIKPQFEVGRGEVGKGGVVRDPAQHEAVCTRIRNWVNGLEGWQVRDIIESPITGPAGNIEFLLWAEKNPDSPSA